MKFRTELDSEPQERKISFSDSVVFMGSCFSENIYKKMDSLKLKVLGNPFGIVYNPISICQQVQEILALKIYEESDLELANERWFSFQHHSDFSDSSKQECLKNINNSLQKAYSSILNASHLFITLGTAHAYWHKANQNWVSNCHKIPSKTFDKKLLETDFMVPQLSETIEAIKKVNSDIQIVFTISPVRHLSDGAFGNQVSKGRLFDVVHQLKEKYDFVSYFNAYELVLDDLRDYRYYADDLVHPSAQAITYVWEKFATTFFHTQTVQQQKQIEKLIQAATHRPFNPQSEAHQKFINKAISNMGSLEKELNISFSNEIEKLTSSQF